MDMREHDTSEMNHEDLLNQYEEMKEMASRDALTGLLNRGALEREINARLERLEETECCAMFIIDLDNFKAVNDTHGHQTGDQVLKKVAWLLSNKFRATDIVGRLGGDEFVVFLSGRLTEEMIRAKGQMICDQLQFFVGMGSKLMVTASVGIHMSFGKKSFEYLYRSADLALYKAKMSGKQSYCMKMNEDDKEEAKQDVHTPVNAIRLRTLFDYIDSGIAMIEMGTPMTFMYVSPAFAHMAGTEAEELASGEALSFIHPDERQEVEILFRDTVMDRNQSVNHMARVLSKSGQVMWWRLHASRIEYHEKKSVILVTAVDVSELKEKESSLQMDKNLFQAAVDQAAQGIWEVEWLPRSFRLIGENKSFPPMLTESQSFPEGLIASQWIHPECADSFRYFAEEIFSGRMQGYANFRIKFCATDSYGWASFSYRTVFDEDGCPVRVVGLIEGMAQGEADDGKRPGSISLPESLMESLVLQVRGNLTRNEVELCWMEGKDVTGEEGFHTCSEVLALEAESIFMPEEGESFLRSLTREGLTAALLERDKRWMMYEYRRMDKGGNIYWVSCTVCLSQDVDTQDVYMALWLGNMDKRRHWEKKYEVSIYKNPITKLYAQSTAQEISMRILEGNQHKLCALVLVEIGGMAVMYARSAENTEAKRRAVTIALMLAMGTNCIPGQFGTDRYLFFFPEIKSEEALKRKLEQTFLFVRNVTSDLVDVSLLRFAAAGVCRYRNETEYSVMLNLVQALGTFWNTAPGDRVVFVDEEKESSRQLQKSQETDRVFALQGEALRPLSDREKDAAFSCILEMINTDSIEETADCMLRFLGEYYDADRAYIVATAENGRILSMPQEWTCAHKHSIRQAVSGMLLEKFPLLERCIREDKPVLLTRESGKAEGEKNVWRFAVFPMRDGGKPEGYLCIENAKNYISDDTLPSLLGSCLLKERKKCLRDTGLHRTQDMAFGAELPNYTSYTETIFRFHSDVYSSLGVVCLDIPEFSLINSRKGFEYGRRMLMYVIQMMSDIFGRLRIYRTGDEEFVILCPNTIQQVFFGKCARLRAALTRRYPQEIRMGYTWSDKVFTGKALVEEAKAIMRSSRPSRESGWDRNLPSALSGFGSVGEMISAGKFTVCFQPKLHMATNRLTGVEALVRGVDEEGGLIAPLLFVEEFEKDGSIRDLDLYVLDYAMKKIEKWMENGKAPVPVSVNFSRATLLGHHLQAAVLAIQSRYPQIPPQMIDIEISEAAGDRNPQAICRVIQQLRELGVTFSLDNFASRYSNLSVFADNSFDTVKIDRSLVADIAENEKHQALVREIVDTCKKKKIMCIAEGVEKVEQIAALLEAGCQYAQGFFYDKPMSEPLFYKKYLRFMLERKDS